MLVKFVFLCSLAATPYATSNRNALRSGSSKVYATINFHCAALNAYDQDSPAAVGGISDCVINVASADNGTELLDDMALYYGKDDKTKSPITAQVMVSIPYLDMGATGLDYSTYPGTCVNYLPGSTGATIFKLFGGVPTASFRLVYDNSADKATTIAYSGLNCTGTGTANAHGFNWNENSVNGKRARGGDTANNFTAATHYGLLLGAANTSSHEADAFRWINLKHFAGQLQGPYSTEHCRGLDPAAATTLNMPVVIPLEAATAVVAGYSEVVPTTQENQCKNLAGNVNGAVAGEAAWLGITRTSDTENGEIQFTFSNGTSALVTGIETASVTCTPGDLIHKAVFSVTWDGYFNSCVQAKNENGTEIVSKYYKLTPNVDSIGSWPSTMAAPSTAASPPAASPASGLHLSAFMASLIAAIAMMM